MSSPWQLIVVKDRPVAVQGTINEAHRVVCDVFIDLAANAIDCFKNLADRPNELGTKALEIAQEVLDLLLEFGLVLED